MELKSPAVGTVLRIYLESGAEVRRGDEVMVIESMKVEIPIKAGGNGRIEQVRVKPGDHVHRNMVLALIEQS